MGSDDTGFLFSTPAMTEIFCLRSQLRAMMRFEWALSAALEKNGIAGAGSGLALERLLDAAFVDVEALRERAAYGGNLAIPFVHQLTSQVKGLNPTAARTLHLGATSQDVLDTALVLQMRDAVRLILAAVEQLDTALAKHVRAHADTLLSGRTWLQPGPPTTLGLKLAGTLAAVRRHRARLLAASERVLVLEFGGAVGTLSALGEAGACVSRELARILEIKEPDLPWHTQRDNLVEMGLALALLCGTLGKFAKDIALLMQFEVAEVAEPAAQGRGGSSTMPQKRNPVGCATILACAVRAPGLAATLLSAMPQEHERGLGLWQAEWETLPELFKLTAASLARAVEIAEGMQVDAARMNSNLDATLGLAQAEAVSVALAGKIGREQAHELLGKAARQAGDSGQHLAGVLKEMAEVTTHLSTEEIDDLLDPRNYLGSAQCFIRLVLGDTDADR